VEGEIGDTGPSRGGHTALPGYEAQAPQLPELQLEQEEPPVPATRVGTPELPVLKQAKVDILRRAGLWQRGHSAGLSAWLKGRNSSNLESHSAQRYSYIGMILLLLIV
jgi:hypothetical protein